LPKAANPFSTLLMFSIEAQGFQAIKPFEQRCKSNSYRAVNLLQACRIFQLKN
jgi:hypothetical protein